MRAHGAPPAPQGADEMVHMEHLINVHASKAARGGIAEFLGYCEVERQQAVGNLTPGLWLVRQRGRAACQGRAQRGGGRPRAVWHPARPV